MHVSPTRTRCVRTYTCIHDIMSSRSSMLTRFPVNKDTPPWLGLGTRLDDGVFSDFYPRAHAQGVKQSSVTTKIARSGHLGI